jgi:hypothetical protein
VLLVLLLPDAAFFFLAPPESEFRRDREDEATVDGRTLEAGEGLLVVEIPDAPPLANGSPRARLRLLVENDFPGAAFLVGKPLPMDGIFPIWRKAMRS